MDSEPFTFKHVSPKINLKHIALDDLAVLNPSKQEIAINMQYASFISMSDIGSGYVDSQSLVEIKQYKAGYTYFRNDDIIIAIITPCMEHGKCALLQNLHNNIGFGSTELIVIRLKNNDVVNKEYLFTYLNRLYIRNMAKRYFVGTSGRQRVPSYFYKEIMIPIISPHTQSHIKCLYDNAIAYMQQSKKLYQQAEELLLKELGLDDFNPISQTSSIKSLKNSFYTTGRLDSEYYQTKYDEYLNKIYNYSGGYELLIDCCVLKDRNYPPNPNSVYRYIELSNIRNNLEITNNGLTSGRELPTRARRKISKGDVIVSSIEGSLNSCGLINDEEDNILCSTGFYIIGSSKINPESLLVLFKSKLMFNLMKKGCSGTILTNITKDEFLKLPIPILDNFLQDNLSNLISKSLDCLNKSKSLLKASTKAVEIAIEDSEDKALEFLSTYFDRYE